MNCIKVKFGLAVKSYVMNESTANGSAAVQSIRHRFDSFREVKTACGHLRNSTGGVRFC